MIFEFGPGRGGGWSEGYFRFHNVSLRHLNFSKGGGGLVPSDYHSKSALAIKYSKLKVIGFIIIIS